jgi:integrase
VPESPRLAVLAANYLRDKVLSEDPSKGFSPSNQDDVRLAIERLVRLFGNHTSLTLTQEVVREGLAQIVHHRTGRELAPRTKCKYRDYLYQVIKHAQKRSLWPRPVPNPAAEIERPASRRRTPAVLEPDEERRLLSCKAINPYHRLYYHARLRTLLRDSEILALLNSDVDRVARTIRVTKTIYRPTTKNGEERLGLPIHSELWAALLPILARRTCGDELLFPYAPTSRQWRADLVTAGITRAYRHTCRRKGCRLIFEQPTAAPGPCPDCGYKLWLTGLPKDIRLYNLRHTGITMYTEADTSEFAIAAMAGHTQKGITKRVYTATRTKMLRREIEKLSFPGAPSCVRGARQGTLPFRPDGGDDP